MNQNNNFALVRKPSSAVEKAAPGAKRILSGMVSDMLSLSKLESWFQIGKNYYFEKNFTEAVKFLRMAAERGHAKAQLHVGYCCENGVGVIKDELEAVRWYEKSAKQGEPSGQSSLGICYLDGKGVEKDCAKGLNLLRQATDKRDPQALGLLAMLYLGQRDCVQADYGEAARFAQIADECGEAEGKTILGILHCNGLGIQQDIGKGIELLQMAAERGSAFACNLLGKFYARGTGVTVDFCESFKWQKLSAERGSKSGAEELDKLLSSLAPNDLQEGERRYREFRLIKK